MIGWVIGGLAVAWLLWGRKPREDAPHSGPNPDPGSVSAAVFGVGSHSDIARQLTPDAISRLRGAIDRSRVGGEDDGDGGAIPQPGMGLPDYR